MADYQYGSRSASAESLSFTAVLIEQRPPFDPGVLPKNVDVIPIGRRPIVRSRLKYYQLMEAKMQVEHCSLSRVVLTLQENGRWDLSLRAEQNPGMKRPGGQLAPFRPEVGRLVTYTDDLLRNQFFVQVRCMTAYPVAEHLRDLSPGKPVLFRLSPTPFWVQRSVPYDFLAGGYRNEVSRYFDLIERVEVEFYFK